MSAEERAGVATIVPVEALRRAFDAAAAEQRSDADGPTAGPRVLATTATRSATLHRVTAVVGGDLAIKVGHRWDAATPEGLSRTTTTIGACLHGVPGIRVVPALGWSERPPAVAYPFIEGRTLHRAILDPGSDPGTLVALVARVGEALGTIHAGLAHLVDAKAEESARVRLAAAARRSLTPRGRVDPAASVAVGDAGPYNVLVDDRGDLYWIDLPATIAVAPVHQDIAAFLVGLTRAVRRRGFIGRRRLGSALRDAFLSGYARTGPIDPRARDERFPLGAFEATKLLKTVRNTWRGGRRIESAGFAGLWMRAVGVVLVRRIGGRR